MTTSERVAYLKGLAEGLGLDKENKQDRLIAAIIDVLEDVALDLEDLEEAALDLGEELDAISDDLAAVEEIIYDEDEFDDYGDDCCGGHHGYEDDCCGGHHGHHHSHEGDCCCDHGEEPIFYEVTCPACENSITIDEDVLALGKIDCPNCGELLEFDMDSIDEDEAPEEE